MNPATQSRYRDRVEHAVRLLTERLEAPPSAEALAREVGVSPFHFQRLYRAATGESVLATLNRLRAVRALELIEAGEGSVTAISAAVGYETPQAFSRAFRAWTGMSPSKARGKTSALKESFRRPAAADPVSVSVEILALEPLCLTIVHTRQPIGPLDTFYEALFGALAQSNRLDDMRGIYGLPLNDPFSDPDAIEDHIAALDVTGGPVRGLERYDVDAGPAVRARHTGRFEDIDRTSLAIYARIIDEGWRLADRPALHHHLDAPEDAAPEALRTDIYIPLEEES